jgi:hypothetical protein
MESLEFDHELHELLRVLGELDDLLRTHGQTGWADRIDRDRRLIAERHPDAFAHLLAAFGGAGGLATVALHPAVGGTVDPADVRPVNDRLRVLRGAAVEKATVLGRELGLKV